MGLEGGEVALKGVKGTRHAAQARAFVDGGAGVEGHYLGRADGVAAPGLVPGSNSLRQGHEGGEKGGDELDLG